MQSAFEAGVERGASHTVPGPLDRIGFLTEQARRRRQTSWFVASCVVAVLLMSVPLAAIVAPLGDLLIAAAVSLLGLFVDVPKTTWLFVNRLGEFVPRLLQPREAQSPGAELAALFVPAFGLMLLVWLAVNGMLRRVGAEATLRFPGARALNGLDLEEQQLGNVTEEIRDAP